MRRLEILNFEIAIVMGRIAIAIVDGHAVQKGARETAIVGYSLFYDHCFL